jgi:hypothetical protein
LRLRWLWCPWKQPDKPWCNSELPVNVTDEALFTAATRVTVQNGHTTKFWTSSWAQCTTLASMFPILFEHNRRKIRTIAEAMSSDAWIRDLMHDTPPTSWRSTLCFGWWLTKLVLIPQTSGRPDEISWTRTANGKYMASSAYQMQFQDSIDSNFKTLIWKVWASSRCKFMIWLMLQNRVWMADRLLLRQWPK